MRSARKLPILLLLSTLPLNLSPAAVLWEIGTPDNNNAEFAFAPKSFESIREDGFFVVGDSTPAQSWPYAQAGPVDTWAGSREHEFSIAFALKAAPPEGKCMLSLDLIDVQQAHGSKLRVNVNGKSFEKALPGGAGDESIRGTPSKGRESIWNIDLPSSLLRAGANEMSIRTIQGSWILYDSVRFDAPEGTELGILPAMTRLGSVQSPSLWLKRNGKAVQAVNVNIRHYGPTAKGELRLGSTIKPIDLRTGSQSIDIDAAALDQARTETLRLIVEGKEEASQDVRIVPPTIREMWLLPHSHVDIGYTHRQDEIVEVQISNLETAMRLARQTATNPPGMRFKWNPEAVWTLDHFLRRATPGKKQEFLEAVRRGDVGVDGLYGNLLTGLCRPEELVQGLGFAARISNLTGVPVESASICDVPGWTWGMVPTMAAAGVKYFAIGPNYRDRVGTIHVWDNKPFYWKSQSGRERVLCWVVDNYHFFGDLEPHILSQVSRLAGINFPYDTSFMFWVGRGPGGYVDNAPPDEQIVEKAQAWNAKYAAPKVIIGLAGEYFRAFEKKHGSRLPEFSGDLTPYWEDGAGSTSRETAMNRASADRLSQAETLFAMREPGTVPLDELDQAWKNVLLYTEHTWGAWCSISQPDDPFTKDQWKVKQAFALDADRQSRQLLANAAGEAAGDSQTQFDVFNTTQWPRSDIALLPAGHSGVFDSKGRPLRSQRLASGELAFLAENVPAFGARRFSARKVSIKEGKADSKRAVAEGCVLENGLVRVEVDSKTGAIKSLRRTGLNHEFVDPKAPVALNDFRYVLGTDAAGAKRNGPVKVNVIERGPVVAMLRIESDAPGCEKLVREVRVIGGLDRVDIINHVDRKSVREKDGVHFGFGFNVPSGKIHMETPWAVVRPDLDQLPGACRNWFTVQRWTEIANSSLGVTWAPLDAPLMEIGAITANLLGVVEFHEWMTNAIDSQTIYSWAQNNHWHTNYKIDQPGVTTFRYSLRPHSGPFAEMESARFGMETTRPFITAPSSSGNASESLLILSPDKVLVESVKPSADGKAIIVRLFGITGRDQSVRLAWPKVRPTAVFETDLSEKPLRKAQDTLQVPAYEVMHLRAEIARK